MRKRTLIVLFATTIFVGYFTGYARKKLGEGISLDIMEQADKVISDVITSDEFQEADEDERLEIAKDTADQLVEEQLVKEESIQVLEEEGVVTFLYEGGGAGVIHTADLPQEEEEISYPEESVVDDVIKKQDEQAEKGGATVVGPSELVPETEDIKAEWSQQIKPLLDVVTDPRPGEMSIRVYNGFEDSLYRMNNYASLSVYWNLSGIETKQITMDNEVFVEELLEIPNYRFVSLSMHGSLGCDGEGNVCPVIILLDDKASSKRDNELKRYLAKYEVAKIYTQYGASYAAFPQLFSNHFSSGDLKDTVVYSESCDFFGECGFPKKCHKIFDMYCDYVYTDFADALCSKGCPAVMGFHNSVYADYALSGLYIWGTTLNMGYTPEHAYCAFTEIMGDTDRKNPQTGNTAYPLLFGNNITYTMGSDSGVSQDDTTSEQDESQDKTTSEQEEEMGPRLKEPGELVYANGNPLYVIELNSDYPQLYVAYRIAAGNRYEGYDEGDIIYVEGQAVSIQDSIREHWIGYTKDEKYIDSIDGKYWAEYCGANFDANTLYETDITDSWIAGKGNDVTLYAENSWREEYLGDGWSGESYELLPGVYKLVSDVEHVSVSAVFDADNGELYAYEIWVSSPEPREKVLIDADMTLK